MTYNILLGGRRGPLNDVVRRSAPDILLVNEGPKQPFTWRRRCERLAAAWGLRFVAGGRPAGSNLILVRFGIAVKSSGSIRLKQPRFQPRRGAAWAQLRVDGRLMGVVSCHLSLDKVRRTEEVEEVIALASVLRGPVVVAGALTVISATGFLLGGVWVVVFAGVLGFSTATVFVLTIALPPLLVAEHDVHRLSAAIFTITYACPFVISLIGGAVWDASGVPYSSFLPIAATGVIMIGLVRGLDLSAAVKGREVATDGRGDRPPQQILAGDSS